MIKQNSKSAGKSLVASIEDIKADGKYDVVVTLSGGSADFPYVLADYHLSIVAAEMQGSEFEKGVGTGPFIHEEWEPGVSYQVKRNPNYFKEGLPYFDGVKVLGHLGYQCPNHGP